MDAVFSALNQGEKITSGLRKVDPSQMTHKNPELRASATIPPAQTSVSPSGSLKRPAKPPKPHSFQKKPAKTELVGNKWNVVRFPSLSLSFLFSRSKIDLRWRVIGIS
jgi:adenylyl cyclase-associated protein